MKPSPEGQGGSKAMKSPWLLVQFQLLRRMHLLATGKEKDMEDGASSLSPPGVLAARTRLVGTVE